MATTAAVYTVRVMKEGRTLSRKQVSMGLGRAEAVVVKAQAGAVYVLGEASGSVGGVAGAAPAKLSAKRVGKNLHLSFEGGGSAGHPDVPDLVIEGYFDFPPAPVLGALEGGGMANYDLGPLSTVATSSTADASQATAGAASSSASAGGVVQSSLPESGLMSGGMWGLVALGGALALGGGGKGSSAPPAAAAAPDAATTAATKITAYANDNSQPTPTAADYIALGVTGVTSSNLAAINSAVDALTGTQVDSKAKMQTVVDAYVRILSEANGLANPDATPTSNPLASDYAAIGANIGLAASNVQALSLLNDVVGNQTTAGVDTIAELNALAAVVDKVMNTAAGGAGTLTSSELALLGLPTSGAGAVNSNNLVAINTAINALSNSGGQSKVDTYTELFNLVTSVATIVNYANDNTQAVPTDTQYGFAGITGVTVTNLGAINSAVDAKSGVDVDTKAKLQSIVDTYTLILAEANGALADATPTSDPTAAQYALIGASLGAASTNVPGLALLNDAIDGLATAAIDTIAEINALAASANAVMAGAAGATGTSAPSLVQLGLLGITGVTADNLIAVQNAIAATADSGLQVDTFAELQAVVTAAVNAASASTAVLTNYATLATNPAPVLADYNNLGVTGVSAVNIGSMNSAVDALSSTGVNMPYKVQALVTAYNGILSEANGALPDATDADPTANDFAAIGAMAGLALNGIASGTDLASNALSLLNDAIGTKTTPDVDTVGEINALAVVVDKVMHLAELATGSTVALTALTMAELASLGVDTGLADTDPERTAILQAIVDSSDTGSGIATILALQAIVAANAH